MPILPAIGISVLIHGLVIIVFRLIAKFKHSRHRRGRPRAYSSMYRRTRISRTKSIIGQVLGSLLVLSIFSIVSLGAFQILQLSFGNEKSSIDLAKRYIKNVASAGTEVSMLHTDDLSSIIINQVNSMGYSEEEEIENYRISQLKTCNALFDEYTNNNGWSLVDYLHQRGDNISFDYRSQLARELGIENYNGEQLQNEEILKKLFIKNSQAQKPSLCRPSVN